MDRRMTICVPYYQAPECLTALASVWAKYPPDDSVRLLLVDDGSPTPLPLAVLARVPLAYTVLRITQDIPWNQPGAKNLAALMADTRWLLFHDIDHVLGVEALARLRETALQPDRCYLFARDGRRAPLRNAMLLTRRWFWQIGGFNEEFSGHYGSDDSEFLARVRLPLTFLSNVRLDVVAAGRPTHLPRETEHNETLRRSLRGRRPQAYIRFNWQRVV